MEVSNNNSCRGVMPKKYRAVSDKIYSNQHDTSNLNLDDLKKEYILNGQLSEDRDDMRQVKNRSSCYTIIDGVLYK